MTDEIKVKVGVDGAAQAATQVDKLTASLEKQRKTQEMVAKTSEQLRRQSLVDDLKKQAAAANGLTDAMQRQQQAVAGASASLKAFGDNSKQLRQHLSPAAALVGNLSNSFSVLIPEAGGATKALQVAGLAGSQMLGVLGGGAGILLGGLVAAVGALASYFANAKKEADDLAKATEANAKAMGSYLDQLQKLRSEVTASRQQQKSEGDLQSRLNKGTASSDEYSDEIGVLQKRLGNQYYSDDAISKLYQAGNRDELVKRQQGRRGLQSQLDKYTRLRSTQDEQAGYLDQQAAEKRSAALDFEVAGTPGGGESGDGGGGKGTPGYLATQERLEKLRQLEAENADKISSYARQIRQNDYDMRMSQLKEEQSAASKAIDEKFQMESEARKREQQDFAAHMQQLAASRKIYQDLATQSSNIMAGTAIKSFQMIAKGQKAEIGAILEGIGDQIVAMGTGYIFKGIAESILLNPQGPALIGVGTAAVGFGIGLGAVGARGAGGSTASGGGAAAANANPYGANPYSNPTSPVNQNQGPTIININMPTVLSPSAEDGLRMKQAADAAFNVYGAKPNYVK